MKNMSVLTSFTVYFGHEKCFSFSSHKYLLLGYDIIPDKMPFQLTHVCPSNIPLV